MDMQHAYMQQETYNFVAKSNERRPLAIKKIA
jgi:hypothetical protein